MSASANSGNHAPATPYRVVVVAVRGSVVDVRFERQLPAIYSGLLARFARLHDA